MDMDDGLDMDMDDGLDMDTDTDMDMDTFMNMDYRHGHEHWAIWQIKSDSYF
jgi:hypothetical protein